MRQPRALLPALTAVLSACAAPDHRPEGTYDLRAVGSDSLPLIRPGHIPGEGTELRGATVTVLRGGRFTARVVLSVTDSSTVAVTQDAAGTWERSGDSLLVAYRWCAVAGCSDSATARDTGRVGPDALVLHRIAGLGPETFGPNRMLRFQRR
jgi:hypothetical protein